MGSSHDLDFHDALVLVSPDFSKPDPGQVGRDLLDVCFQCQPQWSRTLFRDEFGSMLGQGPGPLVTAYRKRQTGSFPA